jgi:sialate O-acetylesterase
VSIYTTLNNEKDFTQMKTVVILILCFSTLLNNSPAMADIQEVVSLKGYWKFNIGDDMAWAEKNYNDNNWDQLYAPGNWEEQGYIEYDGYAWYRTAVNIPKNAGSRQLYLFLDRIDDVNEVYFNGTRIGRTGNFPPKYETAYSVPVTYPIPAELINFDNANTIAVRVFDEGKEGGFVGEDLKIGYDADANMLVQDLSGDWKIGFYYNLSCLNPGFDDSGWDTIHVPASWESQGYNDYNGQACYRKTFKLNNETGGKTLYFIGGKIDDEDQVFLNGKLIGTTRDMYKTKLGNSFAGDWQIRRAYKIPEGLLNTNGNNVIVVLVDDHGGMGGIFEGPVGLMTKEQYLIYEEKYESEEWFPFQNFIKSLFYD